MAYKEKEIKEFKECLNHDILALFVGQVTDATTLFEIHISDWT